MASSTVPPKTSPVTALYLSDTFYTWFNKTNDVISKTNPIEVYSITADVTSNGRGITLSKDGYGNWTIGYILGATIPNGHTFLGNIHFASGVSGHIVNSYNGQTGAVTGVQTVSGYSPTAAGNVKSAIFSINGVTGTTFGSMTLAGGNIADTIGSITANSGYILTSSNASAAGGFTYSARLFNSRPTTAQAALSVQGQHDGQSMGNWVSVNGYTASKVGNTYSALTVNAFPTSRPSIYTSGDATKAPDLFMNETGSVVAGSGMFFMANANAQSDQSGSVISTGNPLFEFKFGAYKSGGGTSLLQISDGDPGVKFNIPDNSHYYFQEAGANVLEIQNDRGKLILGNNGNANIDLDTNPAVSSDHAQIGWNSNDLRFKKANGTVFGIGDVGEIQLGSSSLEGSKGNMLVSQGPGVAPIWDGGGDAVVNQVQAFTTPNWGGGNPNNDYAIFSGTSGTYSFQLTPVGGGIRNQPFTATFSGHLLEQGDHRYSAEIYMSNVGGTNPGVHHAWTGGHEDGNLPGGLHYYKPFSVTIDGRCNSSDGTCQVNVEWTTLWSNSAPSRIAINSVVFAT